jgi:hypothetical protein
MDELITLLAVTLTRIAAVFFASFSSDIRPGWSEGIEGISSNSIPAGLLTPGKTIPS